jgi:lipoprotein NlpI
MKDFQRAIDAYSDGIAHDPTLAEAFYNRALTLIYLGENGLACSDLSKAGELGITEAYSVIRKYCSK